MSLTSKQRAALRGMANTMEPVFQIGKGEIDETLQSLFLLWGNLPILILSRYPATLLRVLSAAKPAPRNCWPRKTWMPVSWNLPRPA